MDTRYPDSIDSQELVPAERETETDTGPKQVQIGIRSARSEARDVLLDGIVNLSEVKPSAEGISIDSDGIRIPDLQTTLVITESALNHFLSGRDQDSFRDLQIAILTGKVRISGRFTGFL